LFLVVDLERRENRVGRDQIGKRHLWNLRTKYWRRRRLGVSLPAGLAECSRKALKGGGP
jgi:hypothetical protein